LSLNNAGTNIASSNSRISHFATQSEQGMAYNAGYAA